MEGKDTQGSGSGVRTVRPRSEGRTAVEVGAGLLTRAAERLRDSVQGLRRPTPWGIAFALVVLVAAVLRFWDLGFRAFHHDEGIHAYYTWLLAAHGIFRHDPLMHGPFQFIATAGLFKIFGDSDTTARFLPAILGTAAVAAPFLLRRYLGRWGALVTAALLALSPTMLYFSRFFRNDMDVVLWSLLLVWAIFRYLDTRRRRYLYAAVAVLSLSFATKEVTYIHLLIFGSFLAILALPDLWSLVRRRVSLSGIGPAASLVLLLGTLALPLGAAGIGLFQGPLGLTLANDNPCRTREYVPPCPDGQYVALGVPLSEKVGVVEGISGPDVAEFTYLHTPGAGELHIGGLTLQGLDVAVGFTLFLFGVGAIMGLLWNRRVWLVSAMIFWAIFVVLFTTLFTNWIGVGTGIWQSLGYWLAQQEERRGGQPWYYYTLVLSTYEFLPVLVGSVSALFLLRARNRFAAFLVFWAVAAFLLYAYSGEKMPWLSVHLALPFILLAGMGLGRLAEAVRGAQGARRLLSFAAIASVVVLAMLTVRASLTVSFSHGDIPTEMLVYTQTSPAIPQTLREIEKLAAATGQGLGIPLTIDDEDAFAWPWWWYLRHYTNVEWTSLSSLTTPPRGQVVVANARNESLMAPLVGERYGEGTRIPFRWWFPENYKVGDRGVTWQEFWDGFTKPELWGKLWRYWWLREPPVPLGHIDAVVYFPKEFTPTGLLIVAKEAETYTSP